MRIGQSPRGTPEDRISGLEVGVDLFVIRHADAVPLGENGINLDYDRPLSPAGAGQARLLAQALPGRSVQLDLVLTSPLLRARQTAEGLAAGWPATVPEIRICDELAPGGRKRKLAKILRECGKERIGLVGHQPDLGKLLAWLIGSRRAEFELAKAGVAYVLCDSQPRKGCGCLQWLVSPTWMH